MSSRKFLMKFFSKLKKTDFKKKDKNEQDPFLETFYKFCKKSHIDDFFDGFLEYLLRNKDFKDEDEKDEYVTDLLDEIYDWIVNRDEEDIKEIAFVTDKDRKESNDRRIAKDSDNNPLGKFTSNRKVYHSDAKVDSGKITINKAKSMRVISNYIQQSSIIYKEDPEETTTEDDQKTKDNIAINIIDEILLDGRKLPEAKKDVEFGKRSVMMDIWRETEERCAKLSSEPMMAKLMTKIYLINTEDFKNKPKKISTMLLEEKRVVIGSNKEEIEIILPPEIFNNCYTQQAYQTNVRLVNNHPLEETVKLTRKKQRCLYVCSGSQMVQGGNADQGLDVCESALYMCSTYSVTLSKVLKAYPLSGNQIFICPNVLVFKNMKYDVLPQSEFTKIGVMCAPNKWRAALVDEKKEELDIISDRLSIYRQKVVYKKDEMYLKIYNNLVQSLEAALFFGYDSIVLDDRGIEDNAAPAFLTAKMLKTAIEKFHGRFNQVIVAIHKKASFNVFRHFFSV